MTGDHAASSDVELLTAIAAGDRTGLDELYARHAPWLLLRLSRRCADRAVVEEAVPACGWPIAPRRDPACWPPGSWSSSGAASDS